MTHAELVTRAVAWLRGSVGCSVVISETPSGMTIEIPDAIGWRRMGCESHLVECKTSRSDFKADRKKLSAQFGMGDYRYYLVPPKLVEPSELPEFWGLAYCYPSKIVRIKKAERRVRDSIRAACESSLLFRDLESHHQIRQGICPWPNQRNETILSELAEMAPKLAPIFAQNKAESIARDQRIKAEKLERETNRERFYSWLLSQTEIPEVAT